MRMAFSFASAPPLVKNTLLNAVAGACDRMRFAASPRVRFTVAGATVVRISACSRIAATTAGCWWPMFTLTSWLAKSRYRRAVEVPDRRCRLPPAIAKRLERALRRPGVEDVGAVELERGLPSAGSRSGRSVMVFLSAFRGDVLGERRDDRLAVHAEGLLFVVVLQVAGELVDADRRAASSFAMWSSAVPSTQNRSTISSGTNSAWVLPARAVLVVVVALAAGDVVGQRFRHRPARSVLGDDVGDVVADHPAEPPALLAHVLPVVADVHRAPRRRT